VSFMRRFASVLALAAFLLPSSYSQNPQQPTDPPARQQQKPKCTDTGTYVNSKGETVKRPENCSAAPQGATAQCRDGSYSFSKSKRNVLPSWRRGEMAFGRRANMRKIVLLTALDSMSMLSLADNSADRT
jgi:Protein of unknown function (DUF3761)